MDAALIVDGVVSQVWRGHAPAGIEGLVLFPAGTVTCGMLWDGTILTAPPPPPPSVPEIISDRQFFHGLYRRDKITRDECMAALKSGDIPAALMVAINQISDPVAREDVEILMTGATEFHRHHPATDQLGAALGYDAAGLDDLWIFASGL